MTVCLYFFFKKKTAYEIYQCDWSSDVCSSDLVEKAQCRFRIAQHEDTYNLGTYFANTAVVSRVFLRTGIGCRDKLLDAAHRIVQVLRGAFFINVPEDLRSL